MVTEAGKELLRNTINTAKFHNRILEENEMWKQWELECGLTMMVSDDDIIKRIKKNHQCSKHRKRDKSRSRDRSRSKHDRAKIKPVAGSSSDRWDHSGFAELYPDAAVPDKHPSTSSISTMDRHKKKKKKKTRHRSDSSDEEIWEEFKRPALFWNRERTLRLIELLRDAPALWNINYPGYRDRHVKLKEIKRIAKVFRVDDENEILTEISSLMYKFHEEHEKLTLKKIKGTTDKFSENEWFAYKHLTFLRNNKNERYCKTVKNGSRKNENPQWVDSSDSYSVSEDEISRPTVNQPNCCIKSDMQDEKNTNLRSYSDREDETFRANFSANQSREFIQSEMMDEKSNMHEKKDNYFCINLPSCNEDEISRKCIKSKLQDEKKINLHSYSGRVDETYQNTANQSSKSIKNKMKDGKSNVREKKGNYTCINLSSCSESEDEKSRKCIKSKMQDEKKANLRSYSNRKDETSQYTANESRKSIKSKIKDEKNNVHGKKDNCSSINFPSCSDSEDERSRKCIKSKLQDEKKINLLSCSRGEDETSRWTANQLSRSIDSEMKHEKSDRHGEKANYTCINLSSCSDIEDERSRKCIKSKVQDGRRDNHGEKTNYTCINISSCSESEDETSRPSVNQLSKCTKSKVLDGKWEKHGKKADNIDTNLPYVQAYMAKKDSFSVYGEIVAHKLRKGKKSWQTVARAQNKINLILEEYAAGSLDSPEDTFK